MTTSKTITLPGFATTDSQKSLYSIKDVKERNAKSEDITRIIEEVLMANDGACYVAMERYLIPPGVAGSKFYDQAYAVRVLLDYDAEYEGVLTALRKARGMSERTMWDLLVRSLKKTGFVMKSGRIVGYLEGPAKPEEGEDGNGSSTADID